MEAVSPFEISVNLYQTKRRHTPEDSTHLNHRRERPVLEPVQPPIQWVPGDLSPAAGAWS
jgi:hypothetical protein